MKKTNALPLMLVLILMLSIVIPMFKPVMSESETTGGTLRVGMSSVTRPRYCLNPLLADGMVFPVMIPIYSTLMRYDEGGALIPDLAWDYQVSSDKLKVTFHLYDNVYWHDGVAFNASDVEYTFETIMNNPSVQDSWLFHVYAIDDVEVIDATIVRFVFSEVFSAFIEYAALVPMIAKHIYDTPKYDLTENPANWEPIGTGPFKFADAHWVGDEIIDISVIYNNDYFRGRPNLDSVFYRWDIPIEQLPNALANNIIDLAPENIDPERIEEMQTIPGITVTITELLSHVSLGINLNNPILSKHEVREAIAHAIDKTKIIEKTLLGYGTEARGPIPPAITRWYNPNVPIYEYNATLAELMLDQLGYPRDPEWRFDLTILVGDYEPLKINASYQVSDDLRAVGIDATVEVKDVHSYSTDLREGNFDLGIIELGPYALDPHFLYEFFHTDSWLNFWGYSSSALEDLLENGLETFDYNQRKTIYDQAQCIIAQDLPNIFLYHRRRMNAHSNDFHGLISKPSLWPASPYILEGVWYEPTFSGQGKSPIKTSITDPFGRTTGYNWSSGQILLEIPNSTYVSETETYKIRSPQPGFYTGIVYGTANGTYSMEFVSISLEYKYVDIPTGNIHLGEIKRYTIQIYENGSIVLVYGDINSDEEVNWRDLLTFALAYGSMEGEPKYVPEADFNDDGEIDWQDLLLLAQSYGNEWEQQP